MFRLSGTKLFLLGNIFFGIGITLSKFILLAIPMGPFLVIRHIVSGLTLLSLAKVSGRWRKLSWDDMKAVGVVGLINITLANVLFFVGLQSVPSTHALLIVLMGPVMVYALSYFVLREKFEKQAFAGMLISFGGVIFLLLGQVAQFGVSARLGGVILILLSTLAGAYAIVRAKKLLDKIEPIQMTAWQLLVGSVPFVFLWGWSLVSFDWLSVELIYLVAFLVMVMVVSPISFGAFYYGLSSVNVSRSVSFMYAQTIVGDIVAVLIFGEALTGVYLISMGIIMFGVWVGRVEFSRAFSLQPLWRVQARLRALGQFAFHKHGNEYHFFKRDLGEL